MKFIKRSNLLLLALCLSMGSATTATAGGTIEIGGKTAVTGNLSITTSKPDVFDVTTTIVYLGTSLTRTSADARWEYGVGLTVGILNFDSDEPGGENGTIATYTPTAQVRINSDLMGPEENFLVYVGAVGGVTIIDFEFYKDEIGAFGPKLGAEYYFSPRVAVQAENVFLVDTEKGINNNFGVGVKFLF
ncbi:MAG: hypothetical protein ACI841_004168 [Planctomycetota bacterium]|jgi:hypothetical protein